MVKIGKAYNLKIILTVGLLFLINTIMDSVYGQLCLRVPLRNYDKMEKILHSNKNIEREDEGGDPKFFENGDFKPFYGLTCITKINKRSSLNMELNRIQTELKREITAILKEEGVIKRDSELKRYYRFVPSGSFHMTVRDIDPSDEFNPERKPFVEVTEGQFKKRLSQVSKAFELIGLPGSISARIKGVKFKDVSKLVNQQSVVIGAYVEFLEQDYDRIIKIGDMVKTETRANVRPFPGHITLAYLLKHPGDTALVRIQAILDKYIDKSIGEFLIDRVDFAYFSSMASFTTILSKDLNSGKITIHNADYGELTKIGGKFLNLKSQRNVDRRNL